MPTVEAPAKSPTKPLLLRAIERRWKGHYMLGPGEVCGDLFWHTPRDSDRVKPGDKATKFNTTIDGAVFRLPTGTELVDPATADPASIPKPPKVVANTAPGGGPRLRKGFNFETNETTP